MGTAAPAPLLPVRPLAVIRGDSSPSAPQGAPETPDPRKAARPKAQR